MIALELSGSNFGSGTISTAGATLTALDTIAMVGSIVASPAVFAVSTVAGGLFAAIYNKTFGNEADKFEISKNKFGFPVSPRNLLNSVASFVIGIIPSLFVRISSIAFNILSKPFVAGFRAGFMLVHGAFHARYIATNLNPETNSYRNREDSSHTRLER